MKFLIIGYYHLADGFKGAADSLAQYGHTIEFFPLSEYIDLYNIHAVHYLESFIARTIEKSHITPASCYLAGYKPDVVLWWNFNIDEKFLIMSRKYNTVNIFYTWDDPFWSDMRPDDNIFQYIDIVFTCCNRAKEYYVRNGCTDVIYLPPGFSIQSHKPIEITNYECDISLICTNLYDKEPYIGKCINRKQLLDTIISDSNINLHIYGPSFLSEIYPNNYKGYISFHQTHVIYNKSRINLNTHVRQNGDMYINERTTQILGSRGLLMIDNIGGFNKIFTNDVHCVIMEENNIVNQIKYILTNYNNYDKIKEAGYQLALEKYTWDSWARTIHYKISNFMLRPQYSMTNITDKELKQLYLLSVAIHNSNFSNKNYLLTINKICECHNIDYNKFLAANIEYITNNIKLI